MKKKLSILIILLISIIVMPLNVKALDIDTLEVTNSNNKLTVSGTTEPGVLAVAILVYQGSNLVHMETCSNNNGYSCELNKTFDVGDYTIKVADYNGGNYLTKNISIKESASPKTNDSISKNVIISIVSIICILLGGIYLYKKRKCN